MAKRWGRPRMMYPLHDGRRSLAVVVLAAVVSVIGRTDSPSALPLQVLVLAGQSNAVGYGADASLLPPELYAPQTDVRFWYDVGITILGTPGPRIDSGNQFVPLQFQSNALIFGGVAHGFGPEIKLGRVLADALPTDIAIVKFAIGGSSLAVDWDPATPGSYYDQMTDDVTLALAALGAMGDTGRVRGFFWMQGEADSQNLAQATAYEANLTNLIQRVRTDLGDPMLPFVFGRTNVN